jgi:hypothetical protein
VVVSIGVFYVGEILLLHVAGGDGRRGFLRYVQGGGDGLAFGVDAQTGRGVGNCGADCGGGEGQDSGESSELHFCW